MSKLYQFDGYRSIVCKHHLPILECQPCMGELGEIELVDKTSLWQKIRRPLGWWRMRKTYKLIQESQDE